MNISDFIAYIFIILFIGSSSIVHGQEGGTPEAPTVKIDLGGALRYNYNNSTWKPLQQQRGGDFGFEVFRLNVDAVHGDMEFHIDQRFYSSGFGGAFLKYGWFQYNFNKHNHLKVGLVPAYFGAQQFNSHSWFFQLPFYLGFEDDHDMGVSFDINQEKFDLDIGFYKNAEELSLGDNNAVSDSRYSYDISGRNREVNQLNIRFNYKLGTSNQHKIGTSLQYGGIWNLDTESTGSQFAVGAHGDFTFGKFKVKAMAFTYNNKPNNAPGENRDIILMTAYGFPYETAAKASIYSIGLAYTVPVSWGPITSIQFYNDYSYMDKSIASWEDTQMNILGTLISANPMYIYVDIGMGKHHPWLGPQWTGALTTGDANNGWERRFNINFGYYY